MRFFLVPQAQKCNSWGRVRLGVKFAKFCQICQICQLLPIWPNFALQGQNLPSLYSFCSLNQRLIKLQSLTLLDCKIGASRTFRSRILQSARSTFTPNIFVFGRSKNANFAKFGKFGKFGKIWQIWPSQVPQPQIDNFPGPRPGKIAFFRKNANLAKFAFFGKNGDLTPPPTPNFTPPYRMVKLGVGGVTGSNLGSGIRIPDSGIRDPDPGFRNPGSGSRDPTSRIWTSGVGHRVGVRDVNLVVTGWPSGCPDTTRMSSWSPTCRSQVCHDTDIDIDMVIQMTSWWKILCRHEKIFHLGQKFFVKHKKILSPQKIFSKKILQKNFL